jgi:CheY-like chemotaxis protein
MATEGRTPDRAAILVVDDRASNLLLLQTVLEPLGHDVSNRSNSFESCRSSRRALALERWLSAFAKADARAIAVVASPRLRGHSMEAS